MAGGPLAARALVLGGVGVDEDAAMATEYEAFVEVMRSEDAVEGSTAFVEKRPPRYVGR